MIPQQDTSDSVVGEARRSLYARGEMIPQQDTSDSPSPAQGEGAGG